jgi:hypothetical protein
MSVVRDVAERDSSHVANPDQYRLLGIYLRDHLGGASAGLALVRRCRRAEHDTSSAVDLAGVEAQIAEDRESLRALMVVLGVSESQLKKVAGRVAAAVSRLKSNGRLLRSSSSNLVVDLEALGAGIATKRNLWLSLLAVADSYSVLDPAALGVLVERATSQLDRLRPVHDRAAAAAFG